MSNEIAKVDQNMLATLNMAVGGGAAKVPLIKVYQINPQDPEKEDGFEYGDFYTSEQDEEGNWKKVKYNETFAAQILLKTEYYISENVYTNEVIDSRTEDFVVFSKDDGRTELFRGPRFELKKQYADLSYVNNLYLYCDDAQVRKLQVKGMSRNNLFSYLKSFDNQAPATVWKTKFWTEKSKQINSKTGKPFPYHEIVFQKQEMLNIGEAYKRIKELLAVKAQMKFQNAKESKELRVVNGKVEDDGFGDEPEVPEPKEGEDVKDDGDEPVKIQDIPF